MFQHSFAGVTALPGRCFKPPKIDISEHFSIQILCSPMLAAGMENQQPKRTLGSGSSGLVARRICLPAVPIFCVFNFGFNDCERKKSGCRAALFTRGRDASLASAQTFSGRVPGCRHTAARLKCALI